MQTAVGYIGADAFTRKAGGRGRPGGGRGKPPGAAAGKAGADADAERVPVGTVRRLESKALVRHVCVALPSCWVMQP